jgi:hypothetical protein
LLHGGKHALPLAAGILKGKQGLTVIPAPEEEFSLLYGVPPGICRRDLGVNKNTAQEEEQQKKVFTPPAGTEKKGRGDRASALLYLASRGKFYFAVSHISAFQVNQ